MDEVTKLGFTFAKEIATTLITVSTGLLTLSVTFAKDVLKSVPKRGQRFLKAAWVVHILSICAGVWTLMALTGTLLVLDPSQRSLVLHANVRGPAAVQILAFAVGTVLLVLAQLGKNAEPPVFHTVSVSRADDLPARLTPLCSDGWEIVSVLPTARGGEYQVLLKKMT